MSVRLLQEYSLEPAEKYNQVPNRILKYLHCVLCTYCIVLLSTYLYHYISLRIVALQGYDEGIFPLLTTL